ncbi:MAG: YeeE/YedE thiosulfate transporter family protein [Sulfuriferula sp.]
MMHQSIIWPAWLAGSGIGLLMVAFFWITGKQLGVSRAYGNFIALISKNPFFQQPDYVSNSWRIWFIVGIVIGGFIAAMIAHPGELVLNFDMGDAYNAILPTDLTLRMVVLFFGGVIMGVGARLAGGCTSGHVISGIPMMNGSSVLSGMLFFVGGIITMQFITRVLISS